MQHLLAVELPLCSCHITMTLNEP